MSSENVQSVAAGGSIAAKTQAFWNAHPCDGQESMDALEAYRHRKEPWLPAFLEKVCAAENEILEIGSGQGTDGLLMCRRLRPGGRYIGLDHSEMSVANARRFAEDLRSVLQVQPEFRVGDARDLPFEDGSIGAVYSMGVLHHVDDTEKTIAEAHRVLKPGGSFYLGLYNTVSAKLLVAHLLRGVQRGLDLLTGQDRYIFHKLLTSRYGKRTGTMLHECFGVPVLKSYTSDGMRRLLRDFEVRSLDSFGSASQGPRAMGYLWVAVARKRLET